MIIAAAGMQHRCSSRGRCGSGRNSGGGRGGSHLGTDNNCSRQSFRKLNAEAAVERSRLIGRRWLQLRILCIMTTVSVRSVREGGAAGSRPSAGQTATPSNGIWRPVVSARPFTGSHIGWMCDWCTEPHWRSDSRRATPSTRSPSAQCSRRDRTWRSQTTSNRRTASYRGAHSQALHKRPPNSGGGTRGASATEGDASSALASTAAAWCGSKTGGAAWAAVAPSNPTARPASGTVCRVAG